MVDTALQIENHPCYSNEAHHKFGRIHLPVAFACNIRCNFCDHKQCVSEHRPGVSQRVMKVEEVLGYIDAVIKAQKNISVVGVAGQGDPLANKKTFQALKIVHEKYPDILKCISTNGYLLLDKIDELKQCGVKTLTVTVNAIIPETGAKIYEHVMGKKGIEGANDLIKRQKLGIKMAVESGLLVKINTVLIPEINKNEIDKIAKYYSELGAYIMNITPLIPLYNFKDKKTPTCHELIEAREKSEEYIQQFRQCLQCRSDSAGLLSNSKSIFDYLLRKNKPVTRFKNIA